MKNPKVALAISVLAVFSMWCYADLILVPYQVADAARTGRPRGNLSDLYPRWLGSRELLLHGRDPYSEEVKREIQAGYYGRPLDPSRQNDPKDQQGFAYPIYVAFLLAPTVQFSFSAVQAVFRWIVVLLIAASVPLWMSAIRAHWTWMGRATAVALVLGTFPAVQAIKLQQLTALVCFLLAASAAALVARRYVLAGFLLALGTIKPQLAVPFAGWLLLWSMGEWRPRQHLVWSFVLTMGGLVLGGQLLLDGWIGRFRSAADAYLQYAGDRSLLDLILGTGAGHLTAAVLILAVAIFCWRARRASPDSELFRWNLGIVLAAVLAVIPTFAPYNQLLLVPAALLIAEQASRLWSQGAMQRIVVAIVVLVTLLPWFAAVGLDVAMILISRPSVERGWAIPLWTSWAIPFPILAALAVCAIQVAKREHTTVAAVANRVRL